MRDYYDYEEKGINYDTKKKIDEIAHEVEVTQKICEKIFKLSDNFKNEKDYYKYDDFLKFMSTEIDTDPSKYGRGGDWTNRQYLEHLRSLVITASGAITRAFNAVDVIADRFLETKESKQNEPQNNKDGVNAKDEEYRLETEGDDENSPYYQGIHSEDNDAGFDFDPDTGSHYTENTKWEDVFEKIYRESLK